MLLNYAINDLNQIRDTRSNFNQILPPTKWHEPQSLRSIHTPQPHIRSLTTIPINRSNTPAPGRFEFGWQQAAASQPALPQSNSWEALHGDVIAWPAQPGRGDWPPRALPSPLAGAHRPATGPPPQHCRHTGRLGQRRRGQGHRRLCLQVAAPFPVSPTQWTCVLQAVHGRTRRSPFQ